mgnify:CR=1 FL=1
MSMLVKLNTVSWVQRSKSRTNPPSLFQQFGKAAYESKSKLNPLLYQINWRKDGNSSIKSVDSSDTALRPPTQPALSTPPLPSRQPRTLCPPKLHSPQHVGTTGRPSKKLVSFLFPTGTPTLRMGFKDSEIHMCVCELVCLLCKVRQDNQSRRKQPNFTLGGPIVKETPAFMKHPAIQPTWLNQPAWATFLGGILRSERTAIPGAIRKHAYPRYKGT